MARLLVFHGDVVDREVELGSTPIRIGRAPECDLVLDDPDRGVSRAHAEVRFDGSGYLIVDLGSQNGLFQYGARVDRAYLEPDSPVTLGPFRLVIDETDSARPMPQQRSGAALRSQPRGESGSYDVDDVDGLDQSSIHARRDAPPWWRSHAKALWLGGAAAVVGGGLILARFLSPQGPTDEERIMQHLAAARTLLEQLEPQRAIAEHIDPALAIDTTNVDANDLKVRAQELLVRLGSGSTPAPVTLPPDASSSPPRPGVAADSAGGSPAAAGPPTRPLPPRPGIQTSAPSPEAPFRAQIDEARQYREKGQWASAERVLDGIIKAGGETAEVRALLADTAMRRRQEGERLFREAADDAANDRFDEAIAKYTRANGVDPTLVVTKQIEEVQQRKLQLGIARFKSADVERKFGRNAEALRLYEQAVRLLPPHDPRYAEAQTWIKELKK